MHSCFFRSCLCSWGQGRWQGRCGAPKSTCVCAALSAAFSSTTETGWVGISLLVSHSFLRGKSSWREMVAGTCEPESSPQDIPRSENSREPHSLVCRKWRPCHLSQQHALIAAVSIVTVHAGSFHEGHMLLQLRGFLVAGKADLLLRHRQIDGRHVALSFRHMTYGARSRHR
jgi:hypothetical protein